MKNISKILLHHISIGCGSDDSLWEPTLTTVWLFYFILAVPQNLSAGIIDVLPLKFYPTYWLCVLLIFSKTFRGTATVLTSSDCRVPGLDLI